MVDMKTFLLGLIIIAAVSTSSFGATCVGATPCNACKNCRYCGYCAKRGGTCGVCAAHDSEKHANKARTSTRIIASR